MYSTRIVELKKRSPIIHFNQLKKNRGKLVLHEQSCEILYLFYITESMLNQYYTHNKPVHSRPIDCASVEIQLLIAYPMLVNM